MIHGSVLSLEEIIKYNVNIKRDPRESFPLTHPRCITILDLFGFSPK